MTLPANYAWLATVQGAPLMIQKALELYGTKELAGGANSPTILAWAAEVGLEHEYTADSIPWCGLFAAVVAKRAGKGVPNNPLWALNWAHFGVPNGQPDLGDILVFTRPGGGHVGIYVGEDRDGAYHVLGGNTHDDVSIARIDKHRLYACRQPLYTTRPLGARPFILEANGPLSRNEA